METSIRSYGNLQHASSFYRATFLVVLLLSTTPTRAESVHQHLIRVEGCPSPVQLSLPERYRPAHTVDQLNRQKQFIDHLHRNPGRKARYSQVYLLNWNQSQNIPYIAIASLGSLGAIQGRISDSDWKSIRAMLIDSIVSQRESAISQYLHQLGLKDARRVQDLRTKIMRVSSDDPRSVVVLGAGSVLETSLKPRKMGFFAAAKLLYAQHCAIYVNIAVRAQSESDLSDLIQISEAVRAE